MPSHPCNWGKFPSCWNRRKFLMASGAGFAGLALGYLLGRDHNPRGFCMFLAGGGSRGGTTYGSTDEFGYRAVEDPMSLPDLHATCLHLLGLDHERLTVRHMARDMRLTDVSGQVVSDLFQ